MHFEHSEDLDFEFYPEVKIAWRDAQSISCSAPWLTLDLVFPFPLETEEEKCAVMPLIARRALQYPLAFATPKRNQSKGEVTSIQQARCICPEQHSLEQFSQIFEFNGIPSPTFQWDRFAIARLSERGAAYDPLAAFTRIRHKIFLEIEQQRSDQLMRVLSHVSMNRLKTILVHILNQSYYVTSHCVTSLSAGDRNPAFSSFDQHLDSYIREENGHQVFIAKALSALGVSPVDNEVHWSVRAAMDLLMWCAVNSRFALANCIGLFEMASYADSDPVATLLEGIGYSQAAKPLLTHFEINKRQQHACIGLDLAQQLESLDFSAVATASRCTELLCHLFGHTNQHFRQLIETT